MDIFNAAKVSGQINIYSKYLCILFTILTLQDGNNDLIDELVANGVSANSPIEEFNNAQPIHAAAEGGHNSTITYLVNTHNVSATAKDNNGYQPIHHAAGAGQNSTIKHLINTHNV